ncbi:MAG: NUDIX hydrolase [Methanobacteriota archaeon]|nr:MAG: NUDIX hydrolase [Euryarchaeota archaeon]
MRRYEFDLIDHELDLDYTPCKGEVVVVFRKGDGVVLMKAKGATRWTLPCARIDMGETAEMAALRVAEGLFGAVVQEAEPRALYDVTRHYSNVSVKRLFIVYSCRTDMELVSKVKDQDSECSLHFGDLDELSLEELDSQALADCL